MATSELKIQGPPGQKRLTNPDGDEMAIDADAVSFDPSGTSLVSTNAADALGELDGKMLAKDASTGRATADIAIEKATGPAAYELYLQDDSEFPNRTAAFYANSDRSAFISARYVGFEVANGVSGYRGLFPVDEPSTDGKLITWHYDAGTDAWVGAWSSAITASATDSGATPVFDGTQWQSVGVLTGDTLTDADETLLIADGSRRVLPSLPLTANRTKTLSATATDGDIIVIERYDTSAYTVAVVDAASVATLYTLPAGAKRSAAFKFDGTNWSFQGSLLLVGG